ncbi:MAG: hypothetical protein ACRC1P_11045 [Cellulosilyticaceae bacterium]
MNKTFKSIGELNAYVEIKLKSIMKQILKECKQELYDTIEYNLYGMYPNSDYDNTMQFLNAVDSNFNIVNDIISVECFVNPDKMKLGIDPKSGWGIHQDNKKNDVREYLPLWLEEGTDLPSLFPRHGANFIGETRKFYEHNFKDILKRKLELRGINTSVV